MSFALESISQQSVIVRVGKSLIFSNADAFKQACLDEVRDGARNFILDFYRVFQRYSSVEAARVALIQPTT